MEIAPLPFPWQTWNGVKIHRINFPPTTLLPPFLSLPPIQLTVTRLQNSVGSYLFVLRPVSCAGARRTGPSVAAAVFYRGGADRGFPIQRLPPTSNSAAHACRDKPARLPYRDIWIFFDSISRNQLGLFIDNNTGILD